MEKPIIFSSEEIRAILAGRKTQTRRVVKTPAKYKNFYLNGAGQWTNSKTGEWHEIAYDAMLNKKNGMASFLVAGDMGWDGGIPCPYGTFSDTLWVRETWADTRYFDSDEGGYVYRATDPCWNDMEGWKWKSPVAMPREASRITLEITGVRVERLQSISEQDAIAEGIASAKLPNEDTFASRWKDYSAKFIKTGFHCPIKSFASLWNSINKRHPWDSNPWVWVIEFKVTQSPSLN